MATESPNPGSTEALAQGCTCAVLDNYHGRGFGNPPQFWISEDCPLHGVLCRAVLEQAERDKAIRVVNCKHERYDVYIGRPSKWGNPFVIGRDGDRAAVIAKYREYLLAKPELLAALPELKRKVLGCWCKPAACHGDVLAELAEPERAT